MDTLVVQKTVEYSRFKKLAANRVVNKNHVKKLKVSLAENQIPVPITVNENMEVIDGQHRLQALEELGAEVYFLVIPGLGLQDVIRLNHDQKNWALRNYVEAYVEEEIDDYQIVLDWDYKFTKLNLQRVIAILQGKIFGGAHQTQVERGTWRIPEGVDLEQAEKTASVLDQVCDALKGVITIQVQDFNALFRIAQDTSYPMLDFIETVEVVKAISKSDDATAKERNMVKSLYSAFKESASIESVIRKLKRWHTEKKAVLQEREEAVPA